MQGYALMLIFGASAGTEGSSSLERSVRSALQERLVDAPKDASVFHHIVDAVETAYADLVDALGPGSPEARSDRVRDIGWMVEELRVSLFAQTLGTAYPVSEKRIRTAIGPWSPIAGENTKPHAAWTAD